MRPRLPVALVCSLVVGSVVIAQVPKPRGAATPQEAVAVAKQAVAANDPITLLPVVSPSGLKALATDALTALMMVIQMSDPSDPFPGTKPPSGAELAKQKKAYADVVALARTTLKPHKLDTFIGKKPLAPETGKALEVALDTTDNVAVITDLYTSMVKMGPMLGMKDSGKSPVPIPDFGTVNAYKINGDKATAQNGAETIDFVKINGRWFLEPPAGAMGSTSPSGSKSDVPGLKAASSGKDPEIVVGGLQIARVTVPDDDFSAKPFHSDNGTTVLLWVKMPAGTGLIELDDDTSTLASFTDDKGTTLSAKFGSFPEEFNDASGGIIEIVSKTLPAPGTTALLAEGSLAMTVATGTKKTKVANVALRNDATLMVGTTKMTVSEVETQGDSQRFTLKLPRAVMVGVKNVAFFDARGQVVEGRRGGSGYMNDQGELTFYAKTQLKTLTLEFEQWQAPRTIKVPFKVRAKIGIE